MCAWVIVLCLHVCMCAGADDGGTMMTMLGRWAQQNAEMTARDAKHRNEGRQRRVAGRCNLQNTAYKTNAKREETRALSAAHQEVIVMTTTDA